ncbi:MAG: UDP-glucose 4-epimerase GalE [Bacteroidota bacterium]
MTVLVTGGAGYIGSHVVRKLLEQNYKVVIIDNLSRGHKESVPGEAVFENADLLDAEAIREVLSRHAIDAIIHFAAFAYVGESVDNPEIYYKNNVGGSISLLSALKDFNIKKVVFSSTCSLYGNPEIIPISEDEGIKPINPYAKTKHMIENVLQDYDTAYGMKHVALRYFNAAGDDFDGVIGESHQPETHLIPIVLEAALGKRKSVQVFGNDYPTSDGTCIRDYIHVYDLADAHIRALKYLSEGGKSEVVNLGTGDGYSVMQIIETAKKVTGCEIPYTVSGRRAGDPAVLIADNKKAKQLLGWSPEHNLEDIISSAWTWHKNMKY